MKGWELLKMLAEGEVNEGDKVVVHDEMNRDWDIHIKDDSLFLTDFSDCLTNLMPDKVLAKSECEIVSKEIDIQAIKRLNVKDSETMNEETIAKRLNEVIEGLKQIDRRLK